MGGYPEPPLGRLRMNLLTRLTNDGKAAKAATYAALLIILSYITLYAVVEVSWWFVAISCSGGWLGTFLAVRREAKRKALGHD